MMSYSHSGLERAHAAVIAACVIALGRIRMLTTHDDQTRQTHPLVSISTERKRVRNTERP